jgi:multisubunit Na+/H+ antiporter MnhB subunit
MDDGGALGFVGFLVCLAAIAICAVGFYLAKQGEYKARAEGRAKRYRVPPPLIIAGLAVLAFLVITLLWR